MKRLIFLSILLPFMVTGSLFAADPALTREIQQAQDQRDGVMLARFFSNPDAEVRRKAIIAAGSVQDTSHIALLVSSLRDPVPGVRAASAFALGQMTQVVSAPQRRLISAGLLASIRDGEDASVVDAAVQGLGKCGDAAGLQDLIPAGQALEDGTLQQSIALAVGRYAYRGIRKMTATAFAAKLLEADTGVPWQAAYAMMRIGADSLLRPFVPPMIRGLQDRSADARMYLAAAIGSAGDDRAVPRLIELATADPDWRVRVNAIRALTSISTDAGGEVILRLTSDPNEHVSLTALGALANAGPGNGGDVRTALEILLGDRSRSSRQRGAAAFALASLFGDSVSTVLDDAFAEGLCPESDYIRSIGLMHGDSAFNRLLSFVRSDDPQSQRHALDGLTSGAIRPERIAQVEQALYHGIQSADMAVMTTAAAALEDSVFYSAGTVTMMSRRLSELHVPDDVEAMIAMIQTLGSIRSGEAKPVLLEMLQFGDRTVADEAAKALERIDGKSYLSDIPARPVVGHTDYDWAYLEELQGANVTVETRAGVLVFELLPDEAPFTCMNFARLIEAGFYDGLVFHRVVPNFVIQGGDPRGDGWGGPGYSIRSEFGTVGYNRGTVGVASAGKDTEGCQFFVTQSKQPHLDGRYTIFGRIRSGIEVVDQIQVGDRILKMRVERRGK